MFALVVLLALLPSFALGTTCNLAQNVFANGTSKLYATDMYWNAACTSDPLNPYCAQTYQGTRCNYCDPDRLNEYWAICDCPANQFCDPDTSSNTYGTCIPAGLTGANCLTYVDCPIKVYSPNVPGGLTVGYWSCIGGHCTPCNDSGIYGNATLVCPGGSPYPLSSRPGETRRCLASGSWLGGGSIVSPTTTTTTTTSGAAPTSASFVLVIAAALLGMRRSALAALLLLLASPAFATQLLVAAYGSDSACSAWSAAPSLLAAGPCQQSTLFSGGYYSLVVNSSSGLYYGYGCGISSCSSPCAGEGFASFGQCFSMGFSYAAAWLVSTAPVTFQAFSDSACKAPLAAAASLTTGACVAYGSGSSGGPYVQVAAAQNGGPAVVSASCSSSSCGLSCGSYVGSATPASCFSLSPGLYARVVSSAVVPLAGAGLLPLISLLFL